MFTKTLVATDLSPASDRVFGRLHGLRQHGTEHILLASRIDPEVCLGWGECLEVCPSSVYVLNERANKMEVANPENCVVLSDRCAGFCSLDAISFPDKEQVKKRLSQLLQELSERKEQA